MLPSLIASLILVAPVAGPITSPVGPRNVFGRSEYHKGTDIACDVGTPIAAAADGQIEFAGYYRSAGNNIKILHPDGKRTIYMHLDRVLVAKGDQVLQGEAIGTCGTTGQSTGPHLHFEWRSRNGEVLRPDFD